MEKINYSDHYVICGWNDLADELLDSFLKQEGDEETPVILVNELSEEEIDSWRSKLNATHMGFVRGDYTQDQVLEKANITKAKAVLLLPNLIKIEPGEADEKTAFAAYSIKALAPKTRVYAYILYAENRSKLRRAKVNGIVVADEFGPFMGAAQLQNPGLPAFLSEVFNAEKPHLQSLPVPEKMVGKTYGELFSKSFDEYGTTILGLYQEDALAGINDFLAADSGDYLDQFIAAKLKESGRTGDEELKVRIRINPEKDYVIKENEHMIILN